MLVLTRKASQRIVIGGNIELVVVAVTGDRVKLGFNAPSDVPIHREEVHRRIHGTDRPIGHDFGTRGGGNPAGQSVASDPVLTRHD